MLSSGWQINKRDSMIDALDLQITADSVNKAAEHLGV